MFAPLDMIPEDPATGSAAAALARFLYESGIARGPFDISQGVDMGRPSLIRVAVDDRGVTVSGQARKVMEGRLTL